jgi:UDP-N-acetylmuramate dehydrogenase
MPASEQAARRLRDIPHLALTPAAPLAARTRFGIGGPADLYLETPRVESLLEALRVIRAQSLPWAVIGGGTNLIAADEGFRGVVLRYAGARILRTERGLLAEAGARLQDLVDFANAQGLSGLQTLAGIPGTVGGAVYGNAGAYGHSISECVSEVWFWDGERLRRLENPACRFGYRQSAFQSWPGAVILSAELRLSPGDPQELARTSAALVALRNRKYPPEMRCAGSIFKNLLYDRLPPAALRALPLELVREGKAPAAWFLEQVGAKGLGRGDIRVADHHANLIYNAGAGTARDLRELIGELKRRVRERFGLELEEEVRYLG